MNKALLFTLLLISQLSLMADTVTLQNGLKLEGKITQIYLNKLTLETDFSDPIIIDFKKVKSFSTAEERSIKFDDEMELTGKFSYVDGKISLIDEQGPSLEDKKFEMLWSKNENAPDYIPPFENKWENKISIDITKEKGNNDETEFEADFETTLTRKFDTLSIKAELEKTKKRDRVTEDEFRLNVDYERLFKVRGAWYVRSELEKDDFEELQVRWTTASGYSHYFVKNKEKILRTRFGLLYRQEQYIDSSFDQKTIGLDLGLRLKFPIDDRTYWYTHVTFTPSLEDTEDYRIEHESGVQVSLSDDHIWSLTFGVEHEYNSVPVVEVEELDTTYFTRLKLKF